MRDRGRTDAQDPLAVVDADRVVLGLVNAEALTGDLTTLIEQVMQPDPVTLRPNVRIGEMPDYFKRHDLRHALVTTSDGVLIGLIRLQSN